MARGCREINVDMLRTARNQKIKVVRNKVVLRKQIIIFDFLLDFLILNVYNIIVE